MIDVLIVGQGLAGTVLGETLLQEGKTVHFIDQGYEKASSVVAAGMYNPIVFKRLNLSWKAPELLSAALHFYTHLEHQYKLVLHETYHIKRFFPNDDYKQLWKDRLSNPDYARYLDVPDQQETDAAIYNEKGYGRVITAGRIRLNTLLQQIRAKWISEALLTQERFDFDQLQVEKERIIYRGIVAKRIVFCQGHEGVDNPFFNALPLRKTKGELLRVRLNGVNDSNLLNKGFFLVPMGDGSHLLGSTYNWKDHTLDPTQEAKTVLLEKLRKLYGGTVEILDHTVGLRPTVSDRRPLIGWHPTHPNVGLFNGLGTKGVLLAPYFAREFVQATFYGGTLNSEVDLNRFFKKP